MNIIFQNESKIDENNNFDVQFKNNQEIIEIFFNQKRDYYLTNAIAFIKNNYEKEIYDIEKIAKKHIAEKEFKPPFPEDIGIDYSSDELFKKLYKKYPYELDKTKLHTYKKKLNILIPIRKKIDEFEVYDALEHLKAGIFYKPSEKNTLDLYSEIGFKLTTGRKIEIKLAASTSQDLRFHNYYWQTQFL